MLKPKLKFFVVLAAICLAVTPVFAQARGLVPCGGYKADGSPEPVCTVVDLFYLVARVTNWLISLAGVYAVYQIIISGLWLAISQGNEEKIKQKKEAILDAILGMILVLMAFMFVNTAVNGLLRSKCPLNLKDPLTYLTIDQNYSDCRQQK